MMYLKKSLVLAILIMFVIVTRALRKKKDIDSHSQTENSVSVKGVSCETQNLSNDFKCKEPGCTIGSQCVTLGLTDKICCPYMVHNVNMRCCPEEIAPGERSQMERVLLDNDGNPIPLQCSLIKIESGKYHCYEIGCVIAEPCSTKGMEGRICCPHWMKGTNVNCCLKMKDMPNIRRECPIFDIHMKQHCTEIGCKEGDECNMIGMEEKACCPIIAQNNKITCCLAPSIISGPYDEKGPLAGVNCSRSDIPTTDICPEVGCNTGERCISMRFLDHPCCPHKVTGGVVNCCLLSPPPPEPPEEPTPEPLKEVPTTEKPRDKKKTKGKCMVTKLEKVLQRIRNNIMRIMNF